MIISGIAATAHADLQGHLLLKGAVDIAQRGVPLCVEHDRRRQIGEVTAMMYIGDELHIIAETDNDDDAAALKLGCFSVGGKPIEREQRGDLWHVTKFRLHEISLVRVPQNDRCLVLSRKPTDPMRKLIKTRAREHDLLIQGMQCAGRALELIQRLHQQEPALM